MARIGGLFIGFFLSLVLTGFGCAQGSTTSGAQGSNSPGALAPEIKHRIQTEIRSRYSVPPSIEVGLSDPKASDIPGYDQITVTFTGGTHNTAFDFLVSKDRKTLARLEKMDISQDMMSKIDIKNRPIRGNANATVTIVNFDDFQCPFCSRMHATLFPGILQAYGDKIRVIYRDYPLVEIHPWAMHAAVNANCLADQSNDAYWDFADYVHGNQKDVSGHSRTEAFANLDRIAKEQGQRHNLDAGKLQACIQKQDESAVRASMAEADKLGVDSTPTLYINGEKSSGVLPEDVLKAMLDRALGQEKVTPPADAKK